MPDWSYQTIFRPFLSRLPSRVSRSFTLGAMGAISRLPGGSFVIRTLGHMELSPILERQAAGLALLSPIGISGGVDPSGAAHKALAQFGPGFIELGPVTVSAIRGDEPIRNDLVSETICYPDYFENDGLAAFAERVSRRDHKLPQFVRLAPMPDASPDEALMQLGRMMEALAEAGAAGFYMDVASGNQSWDQVMNIGESLSRLRCAVTGLPWFLYVPLSLPDERLLELLDCTKEARWHGAVIGEAWLEHILMVEDNQSEIGQPAVEGMQNGMPIRQAVVGKAGLDASLGKAAMLRERMGEDFIIKAGGGVHEPLDALRLLEAGADLIMLHSGLIHSGPGLPKRINEAIIYETVRKEPPPEPIPFWRNWGWMCLLGIGMIIGGLLAWWIGATDVLLSYDTGFLGMSTQEIHHVNHHLLHFMSHDRITLAGTMISIGILYYQLARYGLRYGQHWARTAIVSSCAVGFSSFFLYLGYGYFDPLHALAAAVLLPMFIFSLRGHADRPSRKPVNLRNDRAWRLAMWGQLCFVALGFALAAGGLAIAGVGVTDVFVKADLAFLGTTPDQLNAVNPKLVSLIAHDRAGFGGALLCDAIAILIIALWGIGEGKRWIWWTLLIGGAPGFYAGLSVHYGIGYMDFMHLLPAFVAVFLYIAGLILLYPYMMRRSPI
ncbi:hypothetical protein D3P07_14925 [Paenibacillus sp. 1011MAR3C5]|uniref:hypothetical protein n=1 Tax=Paenibacillus sp. 1011MAR3C5 TaxID=1675787 RepID=UPI000E6D2294|nr:hypothetical protein [Paenibacillus sp. 1011MAR3C5]RJE87607.1 hypothetical protein D3P07_14925 [Paenibacillus sp. 1011MAR3C5]